MNFRLFQLYLQTSHLFLINNKEAIHQFNHGQVLVDIHVPLNRLFFNIMDIKTKFFSNLYVGCRPHLRLIDQ